MFSDRLCIVRWSTTYTSLVAKSVGWVLVLVQLPAGPSRHRVAVWRELRKGGAVPVASGAWALPAGPTFQPVLDRAGSLSTRGGGSLVVVEAQPRDAASEETIRQAFTAARLDEWAEFEADCGKFEEEIAREVAKRKFTFGELEEEEQTMDRLRRWYRELKKRDILRLPQAASALARLRACEAKLGDYAEQVYDTMRAAAAAPGD